jgi:hypothetical protein
VRANWGEIFAAVPHFHAELVRSAWTDDGCWAEWHWRGTRPDGSRLDMRGVTIFGVAGDRIAWGRLYLEQVEAGSQTIDQVVRHMAEGAPPA